MASWQLLSNNFQASNHLWIYTCVCVHGGQAGDWSKIANKATRAFCTSVSIVRVQFYGTAHRYCTCDMSRSCATKFLQVVYARHAERIATEARRRCCCRWNGRCCLLLFRLVASQDRRSRPVIHPTSCVKVLECT